MSTTDPRDTIPSSTTVPERHHMHSLEIHNAKLYEDNCHLVNAVNLLNDRLAFLGAPQNIQVQRFADLQEKLRASEASRSLIDRQYQELLQCTPAGSPANHVVVELQSIREAYASLDREYRILREKYVRLKAAVDATRVPHSQSLLARGLYPVGGSESQAARQLRPNNPASPASVISPGTFQPLQQQNGNNRRRCSDSAVVQLPVRSGPTMTWLAPLPTPPPSGSLPSSQASPAGVPVHTPVPVGSLALPHRPQMFDLRAKSELSSTSQSQHPVEQSQGLAEQPEVPACTSTEKANKETDRSTEQTSIMPSSPCPQKRPNSELQSPEEERKKPRVEGEVDRSTTVGGNTQPASEILSPPTSTDSRTEPTLPTSDSNVRSNEDCVNLIFEKDADVENGVFCGLCLDRYEAKMIQEPPDVLIQPDLDFLVTHCKTMHPAVWEGLHRKT